jgi:AbrB family looped-hinge helix DNA binding protein
MVKNMLIAIDKRGSINLPATIRRELGLSNGDYLDIQVIEGGAVLLQPVEIFGTVRLAKQGLNKLDEARQSGTAPMPAWLAEEMKDAESGPDPEVS